MIVITAKELKQRTGEAIDRVRSGERLTVTWRGKPVAVISPPTTEDMKAWEETRSFEEAWSDIERTLDGAEPPFEDWREAEAWVRGRTRF